jgi:carboxylesterase type B
MLDSTSFAIASGVPTYRYRYMAVFPEAAPPPLRAAHGVDLPVLFNTFMAGQAGLPPVPPSDAAAKASAYVEKAWSAFIANPSRGLKSLNWPNYAGENGGKTLVELFPGNNVQDPILLEDPRIFNDKCALVGLE